MPAAIASAFTAGKGLGVCALTRAVLQNIRDVLCLQVVELIFAHLKYVKMETCAIWTTSTRVLATHRLNDSDIWV